MEVSSCREEWTRRTGAGNRGDEVREVTENSCQWPVASCRSSSVVRKNWQLTTGYWLLLSPPLPFCAIIESHAESDCPAHFLAAEVPRGRCRSAGGLPSAHSSFHRRCRQARACPRRHYGRDRTGCGRRLSLLQRFPPVARSRRGPDSKTDRKSTRLNS